MAQKSNPISLRLKKTNKLWNSCWYGDYNYTSQLLQDRRIEAHIQNICQQAKMAPPVVFLNRQRQQTSAFLFFSRQQRTNRFKRPVPRWGTRNLFQKSALKDANWLQKLLFWSCKVSPKAITPKLRSTERPQLPFARKTGPNSIGIKKDLRPFFNPVKTGSQLFPLFPYLLVSQAATPSNLALQHNAPGCSEIMATHSLIGKDKPQGQARLDLSLCQPKTPCSHAIETLCQVESPRCLTLPRYTLFLWTLKKNSNQTLSFNQENIRQVTHAPMLGSKANNPYTLSHLTARWGFFAMRDQYETPLQVAVGASYANRMPRRDNTGRVAAHPQKAKRKIAGPWKNHLEFVLSRQTHHNSALYFLLCPSVHQNPHFLATQLCFSLENRKIFRRLKDRLMQDISADSSIKGVRITCSGRVAARSKKAQKAKTESIQWGQTSLNVFSDLVNFASKSALTPFGKIGVKVWICYRKIKK